MKEETRVRQIPGEPRRRWFTSDDFDLIVWFDDDGGFAGFELCYDKNRGEHSLIRREPGGFVHTAVDDGEERPGKYKASPILVRDGHFDAGRVYVAFARECASLPEEIADYVLSALEKHPNYRTAPD